MGHHTEITEAEYKRATRRKRITELYLKGFSQGQIAEELKCVRKTIWMDLKEIRKEWRTAILSNFTQMQEKELAVIDQAEATAWEGYERSMEPVKRKTKKTRSIIVDGKVKRVVDITETEEPGKADSSFIAQVLRCVAQRCAILGLTDGDMVAPPAPTVPAQVTNNTVILVKPEEINKFNSQQLEAIKQLSSLLRPQLKTEEVKTED